MAAASAGARPGFSSSSRAVEARAVSCDGGGGEEDVLNLDSPWVWAAEAESRLEEAAAAAAGLHLGAEEAEADEIRGNQERQEDEKFVFNVTIVPAWRPPSTPTSPWSPSASGLMTSTGSTGDALFGPIDRKSPRMRPRQGGPAVASGAAPMSRQRMWSRGSLALTWGRPPRHWASPARGQNPS